MAIAHDASHRGWPQGSTHGAVTLQDKYEVLKEIGDGSFGSVALARVRGAGSHIARRGTLVAIKTMKKTFESFQPCLELREIIFLRTLPNHVHLVPALDIFLDPLSKKLHVAMEYMDGNLYQLMKARDHKPFDGSSVKSILFQILSGLEHIHHNGFFHRDVKPENILVSVSAREDYGSAFKRYSQLVTPPSTPPSYSIKLADFGLARETYSKLPYTTYVSTRWYRAPEVLLRAGEYSAPVDIWAIGAMAVEVATLKPLFPGGNEVDQVWRVCEIMGSPGNWVDKQGRRVGGGEWKEGVHLAKKLGFSFPRMAPHTLDTILQPPQWPPQLADFVTWCLMWDPKQRPTSTQSLQHEYFSDAFDPLRPKSSGSNKLLGRKHSDLTHGHSQNHDHGASLSSKTSSWFRRSLIARDSAPVVPQVTNEPQPPISPRMSPVKSKEFEPSLPPQQPQQQQAQQITQRANPNKRNTWASGANQSAAPMPILPSIRPVSPLSATVTAQAHAGAEQAVETRAPKKIGRQLSMNSTGNHYADNHRQDAERALNGQGDVMTPSGPKESFFSHLRKRARRLSGRSQLPISPRVDDPEAQIPHHQASNRSSMMDMSGANNQSASYSELDRALQNVRNSLDASAGANGPAPPAPVKQPPRVQSNPVLKRHHSLPHGYDPRTQGRGTPSPVAGLSASRSTRRAAQKPSLPTNQYEAPDEQEELLDEALTSAHNAVTQMDRNQQYQYTPQPNRRTYQGPNPDGAYNAPYPTPSPSAKRNSVIFGNNQNAPTPAKPIDIQQNKQTQYSSYPFPTPPYEDNEWAAGAAASIFAAGQQYR